MTRVIFAKAVTTLSTLELLATLTIASPAKATNLSIGDKDTSPKAKINPLLTTFGNPDDYIVSPPSAFDGVVDVLTQEIADPTLFSFCSGSLLTTGRHILTAAHCLTDDSGNLNATNGTVRFELDTGNVIVPVANYFIHPDWQGDFLGGDIAILELDAIAGVTSFTLGGFFPVDIDPFINRSFGEFGFDTRVSTYTNWVDGILSPQTVPESSTMLSSFLIVGLGFLSSKPKKN